jgi:hypothetical protein
MPPASRRKRASRLQRTGLAPRRTDRPVRASAPKPSATAAPRRPTARSARPSVPAPALTGALPPWTDRMRH